MQNLIALLLWQSPERSILMFHLFFHAGLTFPDFGVASGFLWGAHNCTIKGVRLKPGNISRSVWVRSGLAIQGEGGRCTLWDKQREYFVSKRISSETVNHHFYVS